MSTHSSQEAALQVPPEITVDSAPGSPTESVYGIDDDANTRQVLEVGTPPPVDGTDDESGDESDGNNDDDMDASGDEAEAEADEPDQGDGTEREDHKDGTDDDMDATGDEDGDIHQGEDGTDPVDTDEGQADMEDDQGSVESPREQEVSFTAVRGGPNRPFVRGAEREALATHAGNKGVGALLGAKRVAPPLQVLKLVVQALETDRVASSAVVNMALRGIVTAAMTARFRQANAAIRADKAKKNPPPRLQQVKTNLKRARRTVGKYQPMEARTKKQQAVLDSALKRVADYAAELAALAPPKPQPAAQ